MKNLTENEKEEIAWKVLDEYISFDCLADDCNDYCGQIASNELNELALAAMYNMKKDKKLLREISVDFGILPEYLQKMTLDEEYFKSCAHNMAKEFGVYIL